MTTHHLRSSVFHSVRSPCYVICEEGMSELVNYITIIAIECRLQSSPADTLRTCNEQDTLLFIDLQAILLYHDFVYIHMSPHFVNQWCHIEYHA